MSYGVPVIAVNSELNQDLLNNGQNGLLYKSKDLEDFGAKAIRLLTQKKITEHLSTEGIRRVNEKYLASEEYNQFKKLFGELGFSN